MTERTPALAIPAERYEPQAGRPNQAWSEWLADFPPGCFAFVMATGIVSIAAHLLEVPWVPVALFALNLGAYLLLWVITLARLLGFPAALLHDLTRHAVAPTFLTTVAATSVLGVQFALLTSHLDGVALGLWGFAVLLWLALAYGFFLTMTITDPGLSIEHGLSGGWLLVTVSTESLCVLGAVVADLLPRPEIAVFACLCFFLLGGMFYAIFISLIVYRWLFFRMTAAMLAPPYWINMGAVAITTLAGAELMLYAQRHPEFAELLPALAVLTAGSWAAATWWIPLLAALTVWRHAVKRVPLTYDAQYWSIVFPLGMYAAATAVYARATGYAFLLPVPRLFVWIALAVWFAAFNGLLFRTVRSAAAPRKRGEAPAAAALSPRVPLHADDG